MCNVTIRLAIWPHVCLALNNNVMLMDGNALTMSYGVILPSSSKRRLANVPVVMRRVFLLY